jgi:exonuclease III
MAPHLANSDNVPVLLTGDMNAPSHLDYVEGLREKNCGIADFGWPTSVMPQQAGLIDSYRVVYPDPVAVQGTTWSPIYPLSEGETGEPEPQDRIDFIYATKQLEVVNSETKVVGKPKSPPDEADNEWTSDHAAMLTRYKSS